MDTFRKLPFWSLSHRCDCLRISHIGVDQYERWVIVENRGSEEQRRSTERIAKQALVDAANRGLPAGEILMEH